jgi:hypothetical protein
MKKYWLILSAIALVCTACLPSLAPPDASPSALSTQGTLSLSNYNQIQNGMSLAEVEAILGKGQELSRVEVPKAPITTTYLWLGQNGSISVTFEDDKAVNKIQSGLQ